VIVRSRQVTRYYATRTVGALPSEDRDAPTSITQRKAFMREMDAYRWVARGAIFRKRDEQGCPLSPKLRDPEDGSCYCKYCSEAKWRPVVERLARLLKHYDERRVKP
jgi:hypothetical protein